MKTKRYRVTGRGEFPVDMLRYDGSYPVASSDAGAIADSIRRDANSFDVRLETADPTAPCIARWESFLCTVEVEA